MRVTVLSKRVRACVRDGLGPGEIREEEERTGSEAAGASSTSGDGERAERGSGETGVDPRDAIMCTRGVIERLGASSLFVGGARQAHFDNTLLFSSSVRFSLRQGVPGGFVIEDLGKMDVKGRSNLHVFAIAASRSMSWQSSEPLGAADLALRSVAEDEATAARDSVLAPEASANVQQPGGAIAKWRSSKSFRTSFDCAGVVSSHSSSGTQSSSFNVSGSVNASGIALISGSCVTSSDAALDAKTPSSSALDVLRRRGGSARMQSHDDKIDVSLLRFRHRPFWCCARVRVLVYVYVCICVSSC